MSATQTLDTIQVFRRLRDQSSGVNTDELDALFQKLESVSFGNLIGGRWKGGVFQTGHKAIKWLDEIKWYGKQFNSQLDVKPLLCREEDGEIYSRRQNDGEASIWRIEFREELSAAMVYDKVAIVDHFRLVDSATVMGIMTGKDDMVYDNGKYCYFYLERDRHAGGTEGM
ncbi:DUF4334 domain-containing protein [Saccharopolyspora shandongensis]|nr:DUF4334 domain-containing protein [Saccharopolyspora shandongensis]